MIANALIARWIHVSKMLRKNVVQQNKLFNSYDPKFLQQKNKTDDGSEDIERTTWKKEMNVLFIL